MPLPLEPDLLLLLPVLVPVAPVVLALEEVGSTVVGIGLWRLLCFEPVVVLGRY